MAEETRIRSDSRLFYTTFKIAAVLTGLFLIYLFLTQLIKGYDKESWNITELLINYEGGFIRRGLLGQIVISLYRSLNVDPYVLIIGFCAVCYCVFCVVIVKLFLTRQYSLILLPAVYLLGGPVLNDFWVRKDVLLFLCFLSALTFLIRYKSRAAFIPVNLICAFAILCHESFGFWALGSLFLVFLMKKENETILSFQRLVAAFMYFLPSILTFLLCLLNTGNTEIAKTIWTSWEPISFPYNVPADWDPPAAINGVGWSIEQAISYPGRLLHEYSFGIYVPAGLFLEIVFVFLIASYLPLINSLLGDKTETLEQKKSMLHEQKVVSVLLVVQFLLFIPLFILGWDYGRWIFTWITSSICILLIIPVGIKNNIVSAFELIIHNTIGRLPFFRLLIPWYVKINTSIIESISNRRYWVIIYLLAGVSTVGWDLNSFLITTPVGVLVHFARVVL